MKEFAAQRLLYNVELSKLLCNFTENNAFTMTVQQIIILIYYLKK